MTAEPGTFAELVRRYRADALLSQEELADRAALSVRTISDIETGASRWPRPITVSLLAEALGLDASGRDALKLAATRRGLSTTNAGSRRVAPPALIGRDDERKTVGRMLLDDGTRLVTLVGGPGVGKTALALTVASDAAAAFDDNVLVVELVGIPDPRLVSTKVALAAGIRDAGGEPVATAFAAWIARRKMLLVFDTFEHVVAAAPFVAHMLAAAPSLTVLITSRVALHLREERTLLIAPLAEDAAAQLLVECVRRYDPDFSVSSADAADVAALVHALDGVPLAIELAAPRLRKMMPAVLATRLRRSLDGLSAEQRGAPARQRTMHGAIAWSYHLLSEEQQRVFRQLGVFAGAFGEQAALRVAAADASDTLGGLRALAALVDQNLVNVAEDESGDARFEMHALVRAFAYTALKECGEEDAAQLRLARFCSELGKRAPGTPRSRATLDALEREAANFDALLDWLVAHREIEAGLRVANRLYEYWWRRGAYTHGYAWFERLLALAPRAGVEDAVLAEAHLRANGIAQSAGEIERALHHANEALPRKRALGERTGVASLLSGIAMCEALRGDLNGARAHLTEALDIRRELYDGLGAGAALADIGFVACEQGDYESAAAYLEESVALNKAGGSGIGMSAALANLALLSLRRGDTPRAEALAREGLRVAETVGFHEGARIARGFLARALLERGETAAAAEVASEVLAGERVSGVDPPLADALRVLARVARSRGDWDAVARFLGAAECAGGRGPVAAADVHAYDELSTAARAALGARFAAAWETGRAAARGRLADEVRG